MSASEKLDVELTRPAPSVLIKCASRYDFSAIGAFGINTLFPRLRNGGVYVIEDWPWAHDTLEKADDWPAFWPDKEPLTKLVFQLVLACPAIPGLISEVVIDRNSVTIRRGEAAIDKADFDIANCSLARGRNLIA